MRRGTFTHMPGDDDNQRERIDRSLARSEGPVKVEGSGQIDVNVKGDADVKAGKPSGLFKKVKVDKTPQMGNTGGNTAAYSNNNEE